MSIDDVLLVSNIEAGKQEFKPVPMDLEKFCRELVEDLQPSISDQQALVFNALLSVSENHAQSKSLRAFPHNDLSDEFLSETQKCRPIGKTHALSGLQRLRSPRVTEER